MKVTASKLRQDIYNLLDSVLRTGIPLEVVRNGKTLKIVPPEGGNKLKRLRKRDYIVGDPNSLVHIDWSNEWSER